MVQKIFNHFSDFSLEEERQRNLLNSIFVMIRCIEVSFYKSKLIISCLLAIMLDPVRESYIDMRCGALSGHVFSYSAVLIVCFLTCIMLTPTWHPSCNGRVIYTTRMFLYLVSLLMLVVLSSCSLFPVTEKNLNSSVINI